MPNKWVFIVSACLSLGILVLSQLWVSEWVVLPVASLIICLILLVNYRRQARNCAEAAILNSELQDVMDGVSSINQDMSVLSATLSSESYKIADDVGRVDSLVRDAATGLSRSFTELNEYSEQQRRIMNEMIDPEKSNNSDLSMNSFIAETEEVMQYFIDIIVETGRESIRLVYKLDDLCSKVNSIEGLLNDMKKISDQTSLLALNASIEAARAGENGRGFAVVADEVRILSRSSESFSSQINTVVSGAAEGIKDARDTISEMSSRDMKKVFDSKQRVTSITEKIISIQKQASDRLGFVSTLSDDIDMSVSNAVRVLQFEDLSTQLAKHIGDRNTEIAEICSGFEKACANNGKDMFEMINSIRLACADGVERIENVSAMAVSQEKMDEGDIDLF